MFKNGEKKWRNLVLGQALAPQRQRVPESRVFSELALPGQLWCPDKRRKITTSWSCSANFGTLLPSSKVGIRSQAINGGQNHYVVVGIARTTSAFDIKRAYRLLARKVFYSSISHEYVA
ncbi:hypothetical protein Fmac_029191 [Flemingia macrophylla]|uniref:J domain-containing protein n=1 Tax=Flemingia macrophylla TaxID=520843 RepID=A0ABD1L9P1_9FABA